MTDIPNYSYADEMMSPREIGVRRDGSFGGISRAAAGINYYADTIGFGTSTTFAKGAGMQQEPLGIRFFTNTGMTCSNGAPMYEYVDTVTKGTLVGKRVNNELRMMNLPQLRGLAPGILEDAMSALDPRPLLGAVAGSGYPKCKQVTLPVGDLNGSTKSRFDPSNVWIRDPVTMTKTSASEGRTLPHQTRWVFDSWISKEDFDAATKEAGEGFVGQGQTIGKWASVGILALLLTGLCLSSRRSL